MASLIKPKVHTLRLPENLSKDEKSITLGGPTKVPKRMFEVQSAQNQGIYRLEDIYW